METPHLDNIYRDRYQLYHMADGRIFDSREINWRQVEWEKVVLIETFLKKKRYVTKPTTDSFKFFMIWRWGGQEFRNGVMRKIHDWAVGWSDGIKCFMTDLDFKTGEIVRQYVVSISEMERHVHPRVMGQYSTIIR